MSKMEFTEEALILIQKRFEDSYKELTKEIMSEFKLKIYNAETTKNYIQAKSRNRVSKDEVSQYNIREEDEYSIWNVIDSSKKNANLEIDFDNFKLVSHVQEILEQQGKTQTWLINKTKISKSTMYSIINNNNSVSLENAYKIAYVMNKPIEELFEFNPISLDK